ncbi:MAG: HEPN domain-containing protein [Bacteroidales bacterium]|nr:HEPN domain-containing protein [Bacteroidales bacterium]
MEKEEKVQYWIDIANEDLAVAEDMHKTRHWFYVAFMCHQVVEKMLKAYWTAISDEVPVLIRCKCPFPVSSKSMVWSSSQRIWKSVLSVATNAAGVTGWSIPITKLSATTSCSSPFMATTATKSVSASTTTSLARNQTSHAHR